MVETIAVYWEEQIKVYGVSHTYGVEYNRLDFPVSELSTCGHILERLEDSLTIQRFEFISCHVIDATINVHLFTKPTENNVPLQKIIHSFKIEQTITIQNSGQSDLIYLHGPHFQDRYGILDVAVQALTACDLTPLVTGCAGTSMYLAFNAGSGPEAENVLRETFLTPKSV